MCVLVLLMGCDVLLMLFHVSAITDIAICAELFMIRFLSILLMLLRLFHCIAYNTDIADDIAVMIIITDTTYAIDVDDVIVLMCSYN